MQRESWRAFRDIRSVDASASSISSLTGDRATLGRTQMQIGLHSTSSPSSAQSGLMSQSRGPAEYSPVMEPSPLISYQGDLQRASSPVESDVDKTPGAGTASCQFAQHGLLADSFSETIRSPVVDFSPLIPYQGNLQRASSPVESDVDLAAGLCWPGAGTTLQSPVVYPSPLIPYQGNLQWSTSPAECDERAFIFKEAAIISELIHAQAARERECVDESDVSGDENDEDADDFEERCEPCLVESSTSTGGSTSRIRARKIPEEVRAALHEKDVEDGFKKSKCKCAFANSRGVESCIDQFNKQDLRQVHQETYGAAGSPPVSTTAVLHHIHELYYNAMHLPTSKMARARVTDNRGHIFTRGPLVLLGRTVCSQSFRVMVGGTRSAHRLRSAMAMRGIGPATMTATRLADIELRTAEHLDGRHSDRSAWAKCWWATELVLHDWLPNENAIQFKGPFWSTVWQECYKPNAIAQSGYEPLSYKHWKIQMLPGAILLASTFADSVDPDQVKVKRSARHSNFPECTSCQRLRAEYLKVVSTPGSTTFARNVALEAFKEHLQMWQGDRKVALSLNAYTDENDTTKQVWTKVRM